MALDVRRCPITTPCVILGVPSGFEINIGDTLACVPAMFSEAGAVSGFRFIVPLHLSHPRERRLP